MLQKFVALLWTARRRTQQTWRLLRDKRVPLWQKAIPLLPFLYILSPFNFLSFTVPILGQIDDVMLLLFAMEIFERVVDDNILQDHQVR